MAILLRASKVIQGSAELLVESGQIIIGRLPSNHLAIPGVEVEPIHAMIEVDPSTGDAVLVDMASEAGLKLNGKVVEVTEKLKAGDLIQIGKVRIEVLDPAEASGAGEEDVVAPPPPPLSRPAADLRSTIVADKAKVSSSSEKEAVKKKSDLNAAKADAKQATAAHKKKPATARVSYGTLFQPGKERSPGSTLEVVAFWDQSILDVRHYGGVLKKNEAPRPNSVYLGNEEDGHLVGVGPKSGTRNYHFAEVSSSKTTIYLDGDMRARVRRGANFERVQGPGKVSLSGRDIAIVKHGPVNYFFQNVSMPNPMLRKFEDIDGKPVIFWFAAVLWGLLSAGIYVSSKNLKPEEALDNDPWAQVLTVRTPTPRPTALPAAKPPVEVPKPPKEPPKVEPPKKPEPKPVKVVTPSPIKALEKPKPQQNEVANKGVLKGETKNAKDSALGRKNAKLSPGMGGGAKGGTAGAMAGQRQGADKNDQMGVEGGKKNQLSGINLDELGAGVGKVMDVSAVGAIATGLKSSAGGAGAGAGSGARGAHGFGGIGSQNSLSTGGPAKALQGLGGGAGGLGAGGAGGNGSGSFGSKIKAQAVLVPEGDPAIEGGLTREEIEAVIRANLAQIKACYERNLQGDRSLAGRVKVKWIIALNGSVTSSTIASSTLDSPATEGCITAAIKRWKFPLPRGSSPVEVNFPFVMSAR